MRQTPSPGGVRRQSETFSPASKACLHEALVVVQSPSRARLCDPMDCSTSGLPVPHAQHLPEFAQVGLQGARGSKTSVPPSDSPDLQGLETAASPPRPAPPEAPLDSSCTEGLLLPGRCLHTGCQAAKPALWPPGLPHTCACARVCAVPWAPGPGPLCSCVAVSGRVSIRAHL